MSKYSNSMLTIVSRHFQAFFLSRGISLQLTLFAVLSFPICLSLSLQLFSLSLFPLSFPSLFSLSLISHSLFFFLLDIPFCKVSRHCLSFVGD